MDRNPIPRGTPLQRHFTERQEYELFYMVDQADPSPRGSYALWLKNIFKTGQQGPEDIPKIRANLKLFDQLKREKKIVGIQSDIMRMSYDDFVNLIRPYMQAEMRFTPYDRTMQGEVIYEDDDYMIYKTRNASTARRLAEGSDWCVKGSDLSKYYVGRGPLYFVYKDTGGEWTQFSLVSFETVQCMDVNDKWMTLPTELIEFFYDYSRGRHNVADVAATMYPSAMTKRQVGPIDISLLEDFGEYVTNGETGHSTGCLYRYWHMTSQYEKHIEVGLEADEMFASYHNIGSEHAQSFVRNSVGPIIYALSRFLKFESFINDRQRSRIVADMIPRMWKELDEKSDGEYFSRYESIVINLIKINLTPIDVNEVNVEDLRKIFSISDTFGQLPELSARIFAFTDYEPSEYIIYDREFAENAPVDKLASLYMRQDAIKPVVSDYISEWPPEFYIPVARKILRDNPGRVEYRTVLAINNLTIQLLDMGAISLDEAMQEIVRLGTANRFYYHLIEVNPEGADAAFAQVSRMPAFLRQLSPSLLPSNKDWMSISDLRFIANDEMNKIWRSAFLETTYINITEKGYVEEYISYLALKIRGAKSSDKESMAEILNWLEEVSRRVDYGYPAHTISAAIVALMAKLNVPIDAKNTYKIKSALDDFGEEDSYTSEDELASFIDLYELRQYLGDEIYDEYVKDDDDDYDEDDYDED